ncbi:hypothetical protein BC941DRAFT_467208 [Chlamydoabsidia padenii]|nr:hypothetical protein BC941DRAFT_467208 [Chlamydoabsidia padenii]
MDTSSSLLSKKEQRLLDGHLEIDWLKRQIEQRRQGCVSFSAIKEKVAQLTDDQIQDQLQTYPEQVEVSRVQMDIMSQYNLSKERIMTNLDDSHYTLDALYPHLKARLPEFNGEITQKIQELVMQRDKLAVEQMQLLEELNNIQNKTTRLHSQIIGHHQENQLLGTELKTAKQQRDQRYQEQQEPQGWISTQVSLTSSQGTNDYNIDKLHEEENRLETAKNILMGLILESGIDWASDSKWSRVMMFIGTEEEKQED